MSMSDCEKCWDTPCVCGHRYKHLSTLELQELVDKLNTLIRRKILKGDTGNKRYFNG